MGWDLHFINSRKIGEIMDADERFKIEFTNNGSEDIGYLYLFDDDGEKSGVSIPDTTEENYKDILLTYAFLPYSHKLGYFLWELYHEFGIMFSDTCLDNFTYLGNLCENEQEENDLVNYCCAAEMIDFFGNMLDEDHELRKLYERTKPVYEKLYRKYKEQN
jgi:hypothetical protein